MIKHLALLALIGLLGCNSKIKEQSKDGDSADSIKVEVHNPMDQPRKNVMVFIGEEELGDSFKPQSFVVTGEGQEIPSQYNENAQEGIVFVIDQLGANARKTYTISYNFEGDQPHQYQKRTQAELSVKRGGKFENQKYIGGEFVKVDSLRVPDEHTDHSNYVRYEGPGWESDKVAYRYYLDWRNATDVFGKTTGEMVLQQVGQEGSGSYHELGSWGMDVLKVGESLGVGSLGIFHEGEAVRVDETDSIIVKVLENGVVHSAIQTNYYGWKVGRQSLNIRSVFGIHAGTRLTHHEVLVDGNPNNLCTGIGKDVKAKLYTHKGNEQQWGYLATYGAQSLNNDKIGLAVLFSPEHFMEFTEDEHNHIVKLKPESGQLDYYFLAAWELEPNGITQEEEFMDYVTRTAAELAHPVKVTVTEL